MRLVWSRTIVAVFWFATAAYCVLSAIPFALEQFLRPRLVPALSAFAEWHPWISLVALVATAGGLLPWLRSGHRGVRALIAAWFLVAIGLFFVPSLSQLEASTAALVLALFSLVPPAWLSILDLSPVATSARDDTADDVGHDFVASAMAALVVTIFHAVAAFPATLPLSTQAAILEGMRSLLTHLVVFLGVFAVMCVIRGVSRVVTTGDVVEAWTSRGVLAFVLSIFLFTIVLRPLSLIGVRAAVVAAAFGAALAMTLGPRGTGAPRGLAQAMSGLVPRWATRSGSTALAWIAIVGVVVWWLERRATVTDWNFTIAKTTAFVSWLLALAAMIRVLPAWTRGPAWLPFPLCLAVLGVASASGSPAGPLQASDAWKGRDPSLRLIADALAPAAPVSDEGLQDFLQLHTNIPRSTTVAPVTIDLATLEGAPARVRPHIFLFVIDSLRRDYLSPYNPEVTFTPALDRFARESSVFERAFTRYGATGLSVPALWVGGLVLHKQYVMPFGPMNTLAKLLEHEQYDRWLAMDNILDAILPSDFKPTEIDPGIQSGQFSFCLAVNDVRRRLDKLAPDGPPTFVYALPQDIHIATITREGAQPIDGESYGSFYAPYASRLRRLDKCFGDFILDLKARGLFDRSIVIVTADHGDSLGEQGRMGHAYTIFPEIMQVPLIVHLPTDMAASLRAETAAPAYTTDITPTLYALLGHEPRRPTSFFGRPLFRKQGVSLPVRSPEPEMVASSYGSVYGVLLDDARRLYVTDAIARREYAYQLDGSGAGRSRAVTDEDRSSSQRAIRTTVEQIAQFYGYYP